MWSPCNSFLEFRPGPRFTRLCRAQKVAQSMSVSAAGCVIASPTEHIEFWWAGQDLLFALSMSTVALRCVVHWVVACCACWSAHMHFLFSTRIFFLLAPVIASPIEASRGCSKPDLTFPSSLSVPSWSSLIVPLWSLPGLACSFLAPGCPLDALLWLPAWLSSVVISLKVGDERLGPSP